VSLHAPRRPSETLSSVPRRGGHTTAALVRRHSGPGSVRLERGRQRLTTDNGERTAASSRRRPRSPPGEGRFPDRRSRRPRFDDSTTAPGRPRSGADLDASSSARPRRRGVGAAAEASGSSARQAARAAAHAGYAPRPALARPVDSGRGFRMAGAPGRSSLRLAERGGLPEPHGAVTPGTRPTRSRTRHLLTPGRVEHETGDSAIAPRISSRRTHERRGLRAGRVLLGSRAY